jgi:hypothetical protein
MAQHNRFIDALCADWREAGTVTRNTPRADRIMEISRQLNSTEEPVSSLKSGGSDR